MSLIYLAEGLVHFIKAAMPYSYSEKRKPYQFKTKMKIFGKLIFVNELTSLCQAMLTTNTNLANLVTHADTHDQDQEGKRVKQIH